MQDRSEIYFWLKFMINIHFNKKSINILLDTELKTDLNFSPITHQSFLNEIRSKFSVDIPEKEISNLVTVGDLVDYIHVGFQNMYKTK